MVNSIDVSLMLGVYGAKQHMDEKDYSIIVPYGFFRSLCLAELLLFISSLLSLRSHRS